MHILHMFILFALMHPRSSKCELFPISDSSYPHLIITDPASAAVYWHKKAVGFRLAHSAAVRINSRGIRFIPSSHTLKIATPLNDWFNPLTGVSNSQWWFDHVPATEDETEIAHSYTGLEYSNRWRGVPCVPARDSLCHMRSHLLLSDEDQTSSSCSSSSSSMTGRSASINNSSLGDEQYTYSTTSCSFMSRAFPNYPNPAFITVGEAENIPADVRWMLTAGSSPTCPETTTGREAVPPMNARNSMPYQDVSLCNVMGMGGDFIFVPFINRLYSLGDPLGIPAILAIGILVVVMMVVMGHNLQVGVLAPMHISQSCLQSRASTSI